VGSYCITVLPPFSRQRLSYLVDKNFHGSVELYCCEVLESGRQTDMFCSYPFGKSGNMVWMLCCRLWG
jgi:hypothetical protein